ncbi:MAG: hypothetical protein D6751_01030 [Deltaproteobacteria bacterium]|nr:MAG: hypothetical protein D6751_01030 [Deltaproteobacteria bacterium]
MLRPELTYYFLGSVTLASLTGFVLLYCKLNRITRQLVSLASNRQQPSPQQAADQAAKPFDAELLGANMKTLLREQAGTAGSAERYRYIRSLASHGLEAHQIAEILGIGRGEAEQLVKLARLRSTKTVMTEAAA